MSNLDWKVAISSLQNRLRSLDRWVEWVLVLDMVFTAIALDFISIKVKGWATPECRSRNAHELEYQQARKETQIEMTNLDNGYSKG